MNRKLKIPALPKCIMNPKMKKYHHEIKCVLEQFQRDILIDILKNARLSDEAFVEVSTFSDFADTPTGVLDLIRNIKGNEVSRRLFEIRTKALEGKKGSE